ncbi:hypothetical protein [Kitasatospora sp. NPDC097691]|uniref:hypothetical protein n=1 Tax=Kitasatospora sp. NPDC097691 TaxID=3157231 RepID=UPI003321DDCA
MDIHSAIVLQLVLTASDWAPYDEEPTEIRRRIAEGRPLPDPITVADLDTFTRRAFADLGGVTGIEAALLLRSYKRAWLPLTGRH